MTDDKIYNYIVMLAKHSKFDTQHWYRSLRKIVFNDKKIVNDKVLDKLYKSNDLTNFQKVSLKRALTPETETNKYVLQLNEKTKLSNLKKILEKINNE